MAIHEAIVTLGVGDDDGGKHRFKTLFCHDGSPHPIVKVSNTVD